MMNNFPQIQTALRGWQNKITLIKVSQVVQNFKNTTVEQYLIFKGVIQPLSGESLSIKPLESRSWQWLQIHTEKTLELETNDKIKYRNKTFKVMEKKDYSLNGYFEYHIVKAYD
mgnify:FL=1